MSIDVSDIINDGDLAFPFTVTRYTTTFVLGGTVSVPTPIPMFGPVQPATAEDIEMVPEGDRVSGMFTFISSQEILHTNPNGIADTILWNGQNYRVLSVKPWKFNGYWRAVASRMSGN